MHRSGAGLAVLMFFCAYRFFVSLCNAVTTVRGGGPRVSLDLLDRDRFNGVVNCGTCGFRGRERGGKKTKLLFFWYSTRYHHYLRVRLGAAKRGTNQLVN